MDVITYHKWGNRYVLDSYIHEIVIIEEMQFRLCQVQVPLTSSSLFASSRRSTWLLTDCSTLPPSTLRKTYGRPQGWEKAVCVIQGIYSNAWSHVLVSGQYSEEFGMGVGVHQGSFLSPLFFIVVLEVVLITSSAVPWELLYTDDLVLITDTQEECISKL